MKTTNQRQINLKDKRVVLPGEVTHVEIERGNPRLAKLYTKSMGMIPVVATRLHLWFDSFESASSTELARAMWDGPCYSLTGAEVEPDGWDPHGMPSKLMAWGLA